MFASEYQDFQHVTHGCDGCPVLHRAPQMSARARILTEPPSQMNADVSFYGVMLCKLKGRHQ